MNQLIQYYSILRISPSAGIDTIKSSYRRLAKKYHPDIYSGSKDEAERIMRDLNEAIRMLSNAHHQRSQCIEWSTTGSKFFNFEKFSEPDIKTQNPRDKKQTHDLEEEEKFSIRSKVYSNEKEMEETCQNSYGFYPEVSQLKERLAKLSVPLSQAFMVRILETQEYSKAPDVFKEFRDRFMAKYFGRSRIIQLLAEYLLNKGTKKDRRTAISFNKTIKSNGVPIDTKAFVRNFMTQHNIKESKVYGKKPR